MVAFRPIQVIETLASSSSKSTWLPIPGFGNKAMWYLTVEIPFLIAGMMPGTRNTWVPPLNNVIALLWGLPSWQAMVPADMISKSTPLRVRTHMQSQLHKNIAILFSINVSVSVVDNGMLIMLPVQTHLA